MKRDKEVISTFAPGDFVAALFDWASKTLPLHGSGAYWTLKYAIYILPLPFLLITSSCNQQFDPRSELKPTLVMFSILSTDRNEQFVRVEQNYMPPDYNPLAYAHDLGVAGAVVTIYDGRTTVRLSDTALTRPDTNRYQFPIRSYVLHRFVPALGQSYTVTATSAQHGIAVGRVVVPTKPSMSAGALTLAVLDRPSDFGDDGVINFAVLIPSSAGGYVGRLYVYYDVLQDGEWVEGRVEIPYSFLAPDLEDLRYALYPKLSGRPARNQTSVAFNKKLYAKTLSKTADEQFKSHKLIFKWAVFQFMQVDKNLFNYYMSVHANSDPHSIRLDEPSYSNISGGYGMVGAYTLDSLIHILPENFTFNNR